MAQANDVLSTEVLRHGAYICLSGSADARRHLAAAAVPALATRLGLRNEFDPGSGHPPEAVAFLRRVGATPGAIADDELSRAEAIVHVASSRAAVVAEFGAEATQRLAPAVKPRVLAGVVRPKDYTSAAMNQFAYAHAVPQQPGAAAPNAFLLPMSKTAAWWAKDWMERHTYFLPRYEHGRMVSQGHALAAEAGIACLMRRTYKHETSPAPAGSYDFVTYFECADADDDRAERLLGRRQFQGDPAHQGPARPAGRHQGRRLPGHGPARPRRQHPGRHRRPFQPAAARERHRQLRQGGPAGAREDRLRRAAARPRPPGARHVGGADGAGALSGHELASAPVPAARA